MANNTRFDSHERRLQRVGDAPLSRVQQSVESRRAHARHAVELEVSLESESNFYFGLAENLSEGGLFIATHVVRPIGALLEVSLTLPNIPGPIQVMATVRWIREYSETSDTGPGMGVRFEQITPPQATTIRQFLASREPLFFEEG